MKKSKIILASLMAILIAGYLLPERIVIPVANASMKDWNQESFWYEPWGTSGVHKGIDIFGDIGREVLSTTDGVVLFAGQISKGGKVVLILGPKSPRCTTRCGASSAPWVTAGMQRASRRICTIRLSG